MNRNRDKKSKAALISVLSNSTLVALKIIVGIFIGSVSVISEAIHSAVDLLAAVIALLAVRTAGRPPDRKHPFGHGKLENISGTVEALLIFLAAGWIIYESVNKLLRPEPLGIAALGVGVMLLSALMNILVSRMLFRVAKETDSVALEADAWHLRTDVYTSAAVMIGLGVIWIGGAFFPAVNLHWVDPVAAIGVAVLIINAAYELTVKSAQDLMDVSLPPEEESMIRREISKHAPNIRAIRRLRTRKAGSTRFVELTILVDSEMTVDESHHITDVITRGIQEHYEGIVVTIHVEPWKAPRARRGDNPPEKE